MTKKLISVVFLSTSILFSNNVLAAVYFNEDVDVGSPFRSDSSQVVKLDAKVTKDILKRDILKRDILKRDILK